MDERQSILSHGEREIATLRTSGHSVAEIADRRGDTETAIEKALDRIEAKTRRALVTLAESPVTATVAAELDPEDRADLLARLDTPD
jgi:DNA-binding CsgD family transcriptional regulator